MHLVFNKYLKKDKETLILLKKDFLTEFIIFGLMFSFGVMASGGGSNFKALLSKVKEGLLPAKCLFLIVNNGDCGAVQIAKEYGVPCFHISSKTHPDEHEYEKALLNIFEKNPIDLLLLAG